MALYGKEFPLASLRLILMIPITINTILQIYQPLEHSEDKVDQALSVMKFQQLGEESNDVSIRLE
jgi:hypothetical protein